jgi:hypothetical protein
LGQSTASNFFWVFGLDFVFSTQPNPNPKNPKPNPTPNLHKKGNFIKLIQRVQERSGTVNGQEHLGTIESERSNALERIVENGHGTVTVRSRSRIKNERKTVILAALYFKAKKYWNKRLY